jgi:hypothetical protein
MARKKKAKRVVILEPKHPADHFTRAELLEALKKVADAHRPRQKPSDGSQ